MLCTRSPRVDRRAERSAFLVITLGSCCKGRCVSDRVPCFSSLLSFGSFARSPLSSSSFVYALGSCLLRVLFHPPCPPSPLSPRCHALVVSPSPYWSYVSFALQICTSSTLCKWGRVVFGACHAVHARTQQGWLTGEV